MNQINVKSPVLLRKVGASKLIGYIKYIDLDVVTVDWINGTTSNHFISEIRQATSEEEQFQFSIPRDTYVVIGTTNSGKSFAAFDLLAKILLKADFSKTKRTLLIRSEISLIDNIKKLQFALLYNLEELSYKNYDKVIEILASLNIKVFDYNSKLSEDYYDYILDDTNLSYKYIEKNKFPNCSSYIGTQSVGSRIKFGSSRGESTVCNSNNITSLFYSRSFTSLSEDKKSINIKEVNRQINHINNYCIKLKP